MIGVMKGGYGMPYPYNNVDTTMPQRGCISSAQGTTLGINAERIQIG
jgi:ribonucleotide reductase alpha subunit